MGVKVSNYESVPALKYEYFFMERRMFMKSLKNDGRARD